MVVSIRGLAHMPDLSVEVRGHEIIVTKPSQGLEVKYRKLGRSPMLISDD